MKLITGTKLKLGLGTLAAAGVAVALIAQHQAQNALQTENESLTRQVAQLKNDSADLSNRLSTSGNSQPVSSDQLDELLKLRAEVTQLRAIKNLPVSTVPPFTNASPGIKKTIINLKAKFVAVPAGNMSDFETTWAPVGNGTRLLSGQQFELVNKAIQENSQAYLISAPQITTLSGEEARVSVTKPVTIYGDNTNSGAILDVTPYFDSSVFTLNLAAQLNELAGDRSHPGLQIIQLSNQVNLSPGQTVALQTEVYSGGWLPDSPSNALDGPRDILVFVTPKVVDEKQQAATLQNKDMDTALQKKDDAAVQKMNDARQAILALMLFANANQDQYPTNLTSASQYLKEGDMDQIASNFDLLAPASTTNITNNASTIVLREKQAWQSPSGNWLKTYGFADGHVEIHSEPTDNFDNFEQGRILSQQPSAQ